MTEVIANRTFNFIFKGEKIVIGPSRDPSHTSLFLSFSSHDCLIGNTLSCSVDKFMARETFSIEETPAIIKSTSQMIVVSIVIHS